MSMWAVPWVSGKRDEPILSVIFLIFGRNHYQCAEFYQWFLIIAADITDRFSSCQRFYQ